jgi:BON domain
MSGPCAGLVLLSTSDLVWCRAVHRFRLRVDSAMRAATGAVLLGVLCIPCSAGVIAVAPPSAQVAERDMMLTLQARRALLRDPVLGPLNLGVHIRNRVATLWGPVPSAELGFKAELCLRGLVEVVEVRNDLLVTGEGAAAQTLPSPLPPTFLPPPSPPALPGLPTEVPLPPVAAPMAPAIGVPSPVIDDIDLPPRRLPQSK